MPDAFPASAHLLPALISAKSEGVVLMFPESRSGTTTILVDGEVAATVATLGAAVGTYAIFKVLQQIAVATRQVQGEEVIEETEEGVAEAACAGI